ncbi:MAG TPA: hypothetical protein HA348_07165, partial [Thermoplasmata archaeon]|nr:hypothetical protein [Thermoplasmata archaeon]
RRYNHDVWIMVDGSVEERRGGYHTFLEAEVQTLIKKGTEVIVVGTGTSGCVEIDPSAEQLAKDKETEIVCDITPRAVEEYSRLTSKGKKVTAAFHVTC